MRFKDENGWALVDYDHATGRSTWSYFDGEKQHIRVDTPVEHIIKQNQEVRNTASNNWAGDYHRVASIPTNAVFDLELDKAMEQGDDAHLSRFLNDSDNRAWRTKEGQV